MNMRQGLQQRLPSILLTPNALVWSVFLTLLVHAAGAWGMLVLDRDVFVAFTPLNLALMFLLVLWNERADRNAFFQLFLFVFSLGWIAEIIGVNTGWLFGEYQYGSVLGEGMWGVPFLIGVNWFTVVYCSYMLSQWACLQFNWSNLVRVPLSAMIATVFDWIMEPVAVELGFWSWAETEIPLYNYISWYLISLVANLIIDRTAGSRVNHFAPLMLVVQALFFVALRILL